MNEPLYYMEIIVIKAFLIIGGVYMSEGKNWNDYWYLVAVPTGEIFEESIRIQKILSEGLNLYFDSVIPQIHITITPIQILAPDKVTHLKKVIKETLIDFKPFYIETSQFQCFTKNHKSLVLKIDDNKLLYRLQNKLFEHLLPYGYTIPPKVNRWIFHITIISEIFANRILPEDEFKKVCQRVSLKKSPLRGKINLLELWRPVLDKNERIIEKFSL